MEPTVNRQAMRGVRACTSEKSGRGVSGPYLRDLVWKIVNCSTRRAKLGFRQPEKSMEKRG